MSLLLSYHTSNVYASDVSLLKPGVWLNDNIITFFFDYLQHDTFQSLGTLRFVSPGTTFIIAHEDDMDDLSDTLEGCDFTPATTHAFFPINDNASVTKAGGSHWGLLVYEFPTSTWLYYDSMGKGNHANAVHIATKLAPILKKQKTPSKGSLKLDCMTTPQQNNSYDCGVYACAVAEHLAQLVSKNVDLLSKEAKESLFSTVTASHVTSTRTRIKQAIEKLSKAKR